MQCVEVSPCSSGRGMKIESADIQMTSRHDAVEQHSVRESIRARADDRRTGLEGNAARQGGSAAPGSVRISPEAHAAAQADAARAPGLDAGTVNELRYQLLIRMIEAMTGRKVQLAKVADVESQPQPALDIPDPQQAGRRQAGVQPAGLGIEYERHESYFEAEQTQFSARGVVRTADGREIRFGIDLLMSREYSETSTTRLRTGDAPRTQDPLVINFGGTAAELTDLKFEFDLDSDGSPESISFVGSGSGFLVLDRNGDGKVNDGSELFGPASGNGFQELAGHDQDGNGWIDENDAVYELLRIWTRDAEGNDTLSTLAERQVGAISLMNIDTRFDIKGSGNRLDGQVRSTGVYLREDGGVGTVQQVDLAV